jgi:hypothetical protein
MYPRLTCVRGPSVPPAAALAPLHCFVTSVAATVPPTSFGPAVRAMHDRVKEATAFLGPPDGSSRPGGDDLASVVARAVSAQLATVSARLRTEVDKSVGVAMQTMQVCGCGWCGCVGCARFFLGACLGGGYSRI